MRVNFCLMDQKDNIASFLADLDEMSPAGFATALHIKYTTPTLLFQTYPTKWVEHYTSKGLVMYDPAVRWGFENTGAIRWRDQLDDDPYGVIQEAKKYGMTHGVTLAVFNQNSRTVAAFSRSDRDFLDIEIDEISQKLDKLHAATFGVNKLSDADMAALKKMAIRLTHA
jgi:LuxR family transcriptional regulator